MKCINTTKITIPLTFHKTREKIAMIHYTHKCNIFLKYIIKCINQHQQYPTPKDIKIKNITIIDIANAIIISIRTPEVEKTV